LYSSDQLPDWWEYQWKRITQALFEERYEEHKEAKRLIEELKQMIDLSDKPLLQGAVRTVSPFASFFNRVRDNAHNLHEVLKGGWHCCCIGTHKGMLQLERRVDDRESNFKVLFVLPPIQGEGVGNEAVTSYIEQEVEFKILKDEIDERFPSSYEDPNASFDGNTGSHECLVLAESQQRQSEQLSGLESIEENISPRTRSTRTRFQDWIADKSSALRYVRLW
jgi:hypothetical protein